MAVAQGQCWYCERELADAAHADKVHLFGNVARTASGGVSYETAVVEVPRCRACAKAHGRELFLTVILFLVGGLIGVAVYGLISDWLGRVIGWRLFVGLLFIGFGVAGGALGILLGSPLTKLLRGDRRSGSAHHDYPPLKAWLEKGWKVGLRPGKRDIPR